MAAARKPQFGSAAHTGLSYTHRAVILAQSYYTFRIVVLCLLSRVRNGVCVD
jgi:hypothetical protein